MTVPYQRRRRGIPIRYWKTETRDDVWGNTVTVPEDGPWDTTGWVIPQRSSRSEVPGQQEIDVLRIGVDFNLNISLWSRVQIEDTFYDVAAPPGRRNGSRHTRHQTVDLRKRTVEPQEING
jgi:hypothetical protein